MILATAILIFSVVGLVFLIGIKAWEERRGSKLFPGLRAALEVRSLRIIGWVRGDMPRSLGRGVRITRRIVRAYTSYVSARILFYFERVLERVLRKVKTSPTDLRSRGEASPFLREVAAYKRMMEREEEQKSDTIE